MGEGRKQQTRRAGKRCSGHGFHEEKGSGQNKELGKLKLRVMERKKKNISSGEEARLPKSCKFGENRRDETS